MSLKIFERLKNRQLGIDALAILFGIGAVLGTNSMFLQLPLLINNAPEGWRLPADMTLVVQLANVGPIIYSIYAKYTSRKWDHLLIAGLMFAGTVAMFAVAFLDQETAYIFGAERSMAVLGFLFVVSLVVCTASLLFVPYMRNYRDIYLVSYLVGEGLGGFIPSALALIQGVGGNPQCVNATESNSETPLVPFYPDPRFSTSTFFIIIGVMLLLTFAAFVALSSVSADSPERAEVAEDTKPEPDVTSIKNVKSENHMPRRTYVYLLAMVGIMSALGFTIPASIESYSCLPYGNVAYHLAVTLGWMANPLAMCIGFFVTNPRIEFVNLLIGLTFSLAAFVTYLAMMSPFPPLQHTLIGEIMVVTAWVALNGLIGFIRLTITTLFRAGPRMGLFHLGIATQIGTFAGAVLSFYLVNFTEIFIPYSPCTVSPILGSS